MNGQRLSHYQIEEQIGAGGMGVVYRAHDELLDRDVAIKVLPPGALDEAAHKRFRKEALSLARLNHPNIATIHEFASENGVEFLVTEYIAGITLDTRLASGPLPPAEVVRLGLQLAAGLAAAHSQGIVHRDLKPGNLRLTPDGRLKILDFGLAQLIPHASEMGVTATVTQSQETSGTLPYMSPEQLSGEAPDPRSDIWAAGAVLYEMATGHRPFPQDVPALLINAILNQSPERPEKLNSAVPPGLAAIAMKALERDPARRYQSAEELRSDLESPVTQTVLTLSPAHRLRLMVPVVIVLAALAMGLYWILHRKPNVASAPAPPHRRSIAVLGFKNLSANPDKSWLSTAISEMLTTELSQGDQLRTIAGESVAQMKASLALPDEESFSPQTLARIRQNLGSDTVVMGSYVTLGNGVLRLDVRLQDAVAGETLASVSEKGAESEIDNLVSTAGAELRAKLGAGALSDAQSAEVRASLPGNPEAARLYSQGLQSLRLFDALSARDSLEKAAALDPNHAPTHSALAGAWSQLGYEAKAKEQAQKALALSSRSSREERLLIEGRAHELLSEMPQAIDSYRALVQFFPDNIDYGLFLIRALIAGGHGSDAESVLASLRKLPASEGDAARIDLTEASVAAALSDFKRQQTAADRAANRARAVGASLLMAIAFQYEAEALERMGDSVRTIDLMNQAIALFAKAGDRRGAARASLIIGDLLADQGDYAGAMKRYEEGLQTFRAIGAKKSESSTLERIGNVYYAQGNMLEAKKHYEQTLSFDREINDLNMLAGGYGNLANALDGLGDLQGSLAMQQQSLAAFNQVGDRRGASATLFNLGNLSEDLGKLDDANRYHEQALKLAREIAFKRGEPYPLAGLGDVMLARNQLPEARKQYEQAQAMCREMNDEDFVAQMNVALATVALLEKRYADAAPLAREGAAAYEKANTYGNAAWGESVLARSLLAAGNLAEAQKTVAKAAELLRQTTTQSPRFEVALADSRVKARAGKTAEAINELQTAQASAHKFGYALYELQIQLALGEIELASGSPSARPRLAALEKDARARGALLIADQAQTLLAGSGKTPPDR
jgi:eukaryotic-like serine/threonine-protein kinase